MLPQPAPIVQHFYANVNTIITAGEATAGVSPPVRLPFEPLLLAFPLVLFNSYHYASAKWNPLYLLFWKCLCFATPGIQLHFPS